MSIIVRSDGIQFVLQASRKLLSSRKKSQVQHEAHLLVEQRGQFACLFSKGKGQYEVVFSTDPGYLLGESVWHYFNKPENLIYCEAMPNSANLVLIVAQHSSIVMDKKILATTLQSELLPLMTGDLKYRIITSGNVPLRKAESFGTFRFPKKLIESFEVLEAPLLPQLPALQSLQLQPFAKAFKLERKRFSIQTPILIALAVISIIGGGWLLTQTFHTSSTQQTVASHSQTLSSQAPDLEIQELVIMINQLYTLPGWHATEITYQRRVYHVALDSDGAPLSYLRDWAMKHHYLFRLSKQGMGLVFHSRIPIQSTPKTVYSIEDNVTTLANRLSQLIQYQAVRLGSTVQHGQGKETQLDVHLDNISPDVLALLGLQLDGLPVVLTSVSIRLHSGLISGAIQLAVYGE